MRKMLKSFTFSRGGQYTSVWWKQCDRGNISAWIYHSSTWCRIRVSCMYMCVFVYVNLYLCICILTWIHYCNIWCRIRENIKHHSLIFSTQYSIYANLCKSESHHSRSQYIASKRLSFSPALTSQVCVRYDKSFLPEHFAQLHNLRYVATSEIYSQKYTHAHISEMHRNNHYWISIDKTFSNEQLCHKWHIIFCTGLFPMKYFCSNLCNLSWWGRKV